MIMTVILVEENGEFKHHIESEKTEFDTISIIICLQSLCLLIYIVEILLIITTITSTISNKIISILRYLNKMICVQYLIWYQALNRAQK